MPEPPEDERGEHGRSGHDRDDHEPADTRMQQHVEAKPRAPEAVPRRDRRFAKGRRRRARGRSPRPRTGAARAAEAAARSARAARSAGLQAALLAFAPFDPPLAVIESPAINEVDERWIRLAAAVVERSEIREHARVAV